MSLPMGGGVRVSISLTAVEALDLARQINFYLSRAKDIQDKNQIMANEPDKDWEMLLRMLRSIHVSEQVEFKIMPDQLSHGSSGYGNYTTPRDDQYLPKK